MRRGAAARKPRRGEHEEPMVRLLVEDVDPEALLRVADVMRRLEPLSGEREPAGQGGDALEDLGRAVARGGGVRR